MAKATRLWWFLSLTGLCSLSYIALPGCSGSAEDDDDATAGDDDASAGDDDDASTGGDDDDDSTSGGGSGGVYDLNQQPPADDTQVEVTGVVTAMTFKNDFWISDPEGGLYSGIFIFAQYSYP